MSSTMRVRRRCRSAALRGPLRRRDSAMSARRCSRRMRRAPLGHLLGWFRPWPREEKKIAKGSDGGKGYRSLGLAVALGAAWGARRPQGGPERTPEETPVKDFADLYVAL